MSCPQERERGPSTADWRPFDSKRDDLSQMAERVFGESQGDWVMNKMTMFGSLPTGLDLPSNRPGANFDRR